MQHAQSDLMLGKQAYPLQHTPTHSTDPVLLEQPGGKKHEHDE